MKELILKFVGVPKEYQGEKPGDLIQGAIQEANIENMGLGTGMVMFNDWLKTSPMDRKAYYGLVETAKIRVMEHIDYVEDPDNFPMDDIVMATTLVPLLAYKSEIVDGIVNAPDNSESILVLLLPVNVVEYAKEVFSKAGKPEYVDLIKTFPITTRFIASFRHELETRGIDLDEYVNLFTSLTILKSKSFHVDGNENIIN